MGTIQGGIRLGRRIVALVAIALLTCATVSCAKPIQPTELISEPTPQPNRLIGQIAEVSPPATLETLKQIIDAYTPQVRILSPRPGEVLDDTAVTVRIQVRGLPLFKDQTYQLGPHLHLFLDNEPYKAVYDLSEPITFENLSPGTHTLRVFASRPWHESFKNQGAFDQRTFHVVAPTPQNELDANTPLLTYSRPQGTYGAEPIMLDFYLTNAPLHMSAQAEASDDLHDWRIRCTVNDQSFVFDQWQPIWLKGFKPGRNWVQLELIDESGAPIDNRFNNTVRIIDYQPGGDDTLSQLVRGELDLATIAGIIDPTYEPPISPTPEPVEDEKAAEAVSEEDAPTEDLGQQSGIPEPEDVQAQPDAADQNALDSSTSSDAAADSGIQPTPVLQPEESLAPEVPPTEESQPEDKSLAEQKSPETEENLPKPKNLVDDAKADSGEDADDSMPPMDAAVPPDSTAPEKFQPEQPEASEGTAAPVEKPATKKGLADRFKQWRGADQLEPTAPATKAPDDGVDSPSNPPPESDTPPPASSQPESEPESVTPEPPGLMPEVIEPEATEPSLTAPRSLQPEPNDQPEQSPPGENDLEIAPETDLPGDQDSTKDLSSPDDQLQDVPRSPPVPQGRPFI